MSDWITVVQQIFGLRYYEVRMQYPVLITPQIIARPVVMANEFWVLGYLLRIRSMGTATYVSVGDNISQEFRLTTVGETFGWSGNVREVFDLSKLYLKADVADAVVELIAVSKEGNEDAITT